MRNLKNLRLECGYTQEKLGQFLNVQKSVISKYERGTVQPSTEILSLLSDVFNVSVDYLLDRTDKKNTADAPAIDYEKYGLRPVRTKRFPMLGYVACGEPIYADEQFHTFIEASADIDADFCLTAKGDSMTGARILDGDVVFIKKQEMVNDGEIAAVAIGDEVTLKRVYYNREANALMLLAENTAYKPMHYHGAELDQIHILGKAVAFQSVVR